MTDYGVHRDDYLFFQNENNAKEFSSQGIQKLIILAMKLSELNIFINEYDIKPILLLDDLFSELDMKNRNNIFKSLDKNIQIFITTTDLKNINKRIIEKAKIFDLDERVK
jgi:DNA replication and repair protein RecF